MAIIRSKAELYGVAIRRLNHRAEMLEVNPEIIKVLSNTTNEIRTNLPVKMDDGRVKMFEGIRIQHNNVLGPYAGGLRLHPSVSVDSMKVPAIWATMKNALAGIPFGGSMGGITMDRAHYSQGEIERIIRRYTYALGGNIGPEYDIICPEINTDSQIMSWILDTYLATLPPRERGRNTHVVTGKPLELGGSPGWQKAAGQGVVYAVSEWAAERNFDLKDATFIVQGFGNAGIWAAKLLGMSGLKLIAVEDSSGPIADPEGIDPLELSEYVGKHGKIAGFDGAAPTDHKSFFKTRADILVTAALENQINAETAPLLKARLVVEASDGPTDPAGDAILHRKGIEILPDILCNTGSSIVSYLEWLQNKRSECWELEEIDARLHRTIANAYSEVRETIERYELDRRSAAYVRSLYKIEATYKQRGFYP